MAVTVKSTKVADLLAKSRLQREAGESNLIAKNPNDRATTGDVATATNYTIAHIDDQIGGLITSANDVSKRLTNTVEKSTLDILKSVDESKDLRKELDHVRTEMATLKNYVNQAPSEAIKVITVYSQTSNYENGIILKTFDRSRKYALYVKPEDVCNSGLCQKVTCIKVHRGIGFFKSCSIAPLFCCDENEAQNSFDSICQIINTKYKNQSLSSSSLPSSSSSSSSSSAPSPAYATP